MPEKMKQFLLIFAVVTLFLKMNGLALAENVHLGAFSPQTFTEKFSQNISLKVKDSSHDLSADNIRKFIREKEDLAYKPNYHSEIENIYFCRYKNSMHCNLLFDVKKDFHVQKISGVYLDESSLAQYLEDLARQVNKDPQNATLQADENGKISVFALSTNGIELDNEKNVRLLIDYFRSSTDSGSIELAYKETVPEITTNSINNLGITSLIGEGKSNFAGSPKNRIFNIKVAINRFNGVLIKPGENFSFVKTLGEVDGEHGYLPELVIKKDKTEPEFGGGICQVSTTAFRAAIYSGLKITARKNHAYPVSYYNPQGMDSTVYIPYPDLRFTNNTPGYILIQTKIVGTQLIFDFYGTPDGRKIDVTGPKILERKPDGSMKTTFTQQVADKDGVVFINDVFNSSYDSPYKYPHPGSTPLTTKPSNWTKDEWKQYKKDNNL